MPKVWKFVLALPWIAAVGVQAQLSTPDTLWRQGVGGVPGSAGSQDKFGKVFASGDFNGDGLEDLAVGIEDEGDAGAVQLFYGSRLGLVPMVSVILQSSLVGISDSSETGDRFGSAVAAGNFNADGYDDLAIGAAGESIGTALNCGVVHVLYGSAAGLQLTGSKYLHQNLSDSSGAAGGCESYDEFGGALVAGDFDGDGIRNDLAIGAPGEQVVLTSTKNGAVQVVYGPFPHSTMGSNTLFSQVNLGSTTYEPSDIEGFGASLAAGYLDNDNYEDLAIGVPLDEHLPGGGAEVKSGSVHVLFGAGGGLTTSGNQTWHNDLPQFDMGWSEGDRFGQSLAIADFDGDGIEDLAIGVPGWRINESNRDVGVVHVLYGGNNPNQLGAQLDTLRQGVHGIGGPGAQQQAMDYFGGALAAGRFAPGKGPGFDYLAIGVPGEDADGINSSGSVNVVYGSLNGLNAAEQNDAFSQNTTDFGAGESSEAFDELGKSLGTGDWNGDGRPDLAIGVPSENLGTVSDAGIFHALFYPLDPEIFSDDFNLNDLNVWDEIFMEPGS